MKATRHGPVSEAPTLPSSSTSNSTTTSTTTERNLISLLCDCGVDGVMAAAREQRHASSSCSCGRLLGGRTNYHWLIPKKRRNVETSKRRAAAAAVSRAFHLCRCWLLVVSSLNLLDVRRTRFLHSIRFSNFFLFCREKNRFRTKS